MTAHDDTAFLARWVAVML